MKKFLTLAAMTFIFSAANAQKVFSVNYENQADVKIYFVQYENQAGWRNQSKKHYFY